MSDIVRAKAVRALDLVARARARAAPNSRTAAEQEDLRRRVAQLEEEVKEARRLHRRLAELTDVVEELLVPIALRDEQQVRAMVDRYRAGL